MLVKIHERKIFSGGREQIRRIIAICDKELLGKVFTEGERVLDLKIYKSFYDGDKLAEEEIIEIIKSAVNANIVGKKSINLASKAIKIEKKNIKKIAGIPHLQIYKV